MLGEMIPRISYLLSVMKTAEGSELTKSVSMGKELPDIEQHPG